MTGAGALREDGCVPHLLRIDASIGPDSRTRAIADAYEEAWRARGDDWTVQVRDVVAEPLPHLTSPALHWPERLRGGLEAPAEHEALQQRVLAEIDAADVLLVGVPMLNFSMPSQLKAWLDLVHVPGLTAPFDGDEQPFAGTTAVLVTARGGVYDDESLALLDHAIPPVRIVLERGLGMRVSTIATSRTIAAMRPELDVALAKVELDAALAAAREHAAAFTP